MNTPIDLAVEREGQHTPDNAGAEIAALKAEVAAASDALREAKERLYVAQMRNAGVQAGDLVQEQQGKGRRGYVRSGGMFDRSGGCWLHVFLQKKDGSRGEQTTTFYGPWRKVAQTGERT